MTAKKVTMPAPRPIELRTSTGMGASAKRQIMSVMPDVTTVWPGTRLWWWRGWEVSASAR